MYNGSIFVTFSSHWLSKVILTEKHFNTKTESQLFVFKTVAETKKAAKQMINAQKNGIYAFDHLKNCSFLKSHYVAL